MAEAKAPRIPTLLETMTTKLSLPTGASNAKGTPVKTRLPFDKKEIKALFNEIPSPVNWTSFDIYTQEKERFTIFEMNRDPSKNNQAITWDHTTQPKDNPRVIHSGGIGESDDAKVLEYLCGDDIIGVAVDFHWKGELQPVQPGTFYDRYKHHIVRDNRQFFINFGCTDQITLF